MTRETLGRRAFLGRPLLLVTLFGLLLLGAAAAGAVLSWTGRRLDLRGRVTVGNR